MAGNYLTTILCDAESEGTSSTTVTKDLPRANFIAGVFVKMKMTGTSPTATLTRVQVMGNGSAAILDVSGDELQKYNRFVFGTAAPTNADGGAEADYYIPFQRFIGDGEALLSAKLFRTLQAKFTWTFGGTVTASAMTVQTIEMVSADSPYAKWQLRLTEVSGAASTAASGYKDFALPLGSLHRHYLVNATGTDGTTVTQVTVRINSGAEIPLDAKWETLRRLAELTRSGLGAVANWAFIDFDPDRSFQYAIQSAAANDINVRLQQGAAGQTTSIVLADAVLIPAPN